MITQEIKQENRIDRLVNLLGRTVDSEFSIGRFSSSFLAEQLATPLYVYSGDAVIKQIRYIKDSLGANAEIYYSLKANPSLGLCQVVAAHGVGAEVASSGELILAQRAGFPRNKTIFAGPGKTNQELELALHSEIQSINVESPLEIERLRMIASRREWPANISIRVNPVEPMKGARMRMAGSSQQFGIDEEQLLELVGLIKDDKYVHLIGLHSYPGTQIFDTEALLMHCHHLVDLAIETATCIDRPLEILDFGGGFGVPYFQDLPEFNLPGFAEGFQQVVDRCRNTPLLENCKLVFEPGRYLTAQAGVYITRVVDVKYSRGRTMVVTDGGMNHHITATGNFGQVFRKPYPIAPLTRMNEPQTETVTIAGPCCTPLDVFAQNIPFAKVFVGDLIGVFYSGAYGYSASSLAFLSHPTPAEALVLNDVVHLLRRAGTPEQILDNQIDLHQSFVYPSRLGEAPRRSAA